MEPQGPDNDSANSGTMYRCKFCGVECPTRQSLGGHSNIHRKERAQQQMQAVEAVRRSRFLYVSYDGYVWSTDHDATYYPMRPFHPSLECHPAGAIVYPATHATASDSTTTGYTPVIVEVGPELNVTNVDEEGGKLDLTLKL